MSNLTIVILAIITIALMVRFAYQLSMKHFKKESNDDFYERYAQKKAIDDIIEEEPINYTELDELFHVPYSDDISELDADLLLLEDSHYN